MTTYPGGKNGSGVWQRIISLQPPHTDYVEPFLGSGAVLRRKLPAPGRNVGVDVDRSVIDRHGAARSDVELIEDNALEWLKEYRWKGSEMVYCDPPYIGTARSSQRRIYRHEILSTAAHAELLRILTTIPAMVQLSGYPSPLYCRALGSWECVTYQAVTRGGMKTECLWMNYPMPSALHDYRFLGEDFHDRCRIGRKIGRLVNKLGALPKLERAAVIAAVNEAAVK